MPQQNVIIDATSFSILKGCARLYDYRINQSLIAKEGKSNSLEAGSLVHIIKEWYNKARIAGKDRNTAIDEGFAAGKEFINGWNESNKYLKVDSDYAGSKLIEESTKNDIGWSDVFKTMNEYFDYYRNDSFTIIAAEETRGKIIYEDSELRILWKAKFDEIVDMSNGVFPVDTKSMKQKRETVSNNYQFMGQCCVLGTRSMMVDKVGFQKTLPAHEKFERSIIPYTYDRLEEFRTEIVPHEARLLLAYAEAEHYPPNFSNCDQKYGKCDFYKYDVCNSDRKMRQQMIDLYFKVGKKWDPSND